MTAAQSDPCVGAASTSVLRRAYGVTALGDEADPSIALLGTNTQAEE